MAARPAGFAQIAPDPIAAPTATPTATPAPTPGNPAEPTVTVTPGVVDSVTMDAYTAARTPQASVALVATGAGGPVSTSVALSNGSDTPALQPVIRGGVSTFIAVPSAPAAGTNLNKLTGTRAAAPAANSALQPVPATVTLSYGADHAGQPVWVQTLHGGALSAPDETGELHPANGGGFYLIISSGGTVTFTFQAPAVSDVYRVYTRLDNVATTLVFEVPDPADS